MRTIGHIHNQEHAERFCSYLLSLGVSSMYELEEGDTYSIWVLNEDQLNVATSELKDFLQNPEKDTYKEAERIAKKIQESETVKAREQQREAQRQIRAAQLSTYGIVTLSLLVISCLVFLISQLELIPSLDSWLAISQYAPAPSHPWWASLLEIRQGQVWRLVTPIFRHFNFFHILFNMLWLFDLGSTIERKKGSFFMFLFVVLVASVSNLAQYAVEGFAFGGMSGVVYAMLGYVWMMSRYAPREGFYLHPTTVVMMIGWLVLGFLGIIGGMANMAHGVGLAAGVIWGYLASHRVGG